MVGAAFLSMLQVALQESPQKRKGFV